MYMYIYIYIYIFIERERYTHICIQPGRSFGAIDADDGAVSTSF